MAATGFKLENQNEVGCLFLEEPTPLGAWEQQFACTDDGFNIGLPGLLEYEPLPLSMITTSHVDHDQFNYFEDISGDFTLWDFDDQQPAFNDNLNSNTPIMNVQNNISIIDQNEDVHARNIEEVARRNGRYKSSSLKLEEVQKYFHLPITKAAKELNVGLTVLKKRCRELNIARWPHRKIKSLKSLIHNVKELGLTNEIEMLEEHKRMVERIPEMELTERTKKLRQACFKANYKKRRSLQQPLLC